MAEMIIKLKGNVINRKHIQKTPFYFGSNQNNDFVLDNPAISSSHFRILYENYQYKLVDDSSTNGTFLNEQKVSEKVLEPGMTFVVGKFLIEITDLHKAPEVVEADDGHGEKKSFRSTVQLSDGELKNVLQAALEKRDAQAQAPSSSANVTPRLSSPNNPTPRPPAAPSYTPPPEASGSNNTLLIVIGVVIILMLGVIIGKLM